MTAPAYSVADVRRGYSWLGHPRESFTEVSLLHPEYRPGDTTWNRAHASWPRTFYVQSYAQLQHLVHAFAGSRMICYGLNPRTDRFTHADGRVRSAKEADIGASQSLLLDIDLVGPVTSSRMVSLVSFLNSADAYCHDRGFGRGVRAGTGRGSHLLFPYKPITVAEVPDLRDRLRTFKELFVTEFRHDLDRLETKVDSTQDLRRMVRVYGTSKPGGVVSYFYGSKRQPDERLRDYLLNLTPTKSTASAGASPLQIAPVLPEYFPKLLASDPVLRDLWEGRGKKDGDKTSSGYDYTIAQHLLQAGKPDEDIATILNHRPAGAAERSRKGPEYLSRTINNAKRSKG